MAVAANVAYYRYTAAKNHMIPISRKNRITPYFSSEWILWNKRLQRISVSPSLP